MKVLVETNVTNEMLGIDKEPEKVRIAKGEFVDVLSPTVRDWIMVSVKRDNKDVYWVFKSDWLNW